VVYLERSPWWVYVHSVGFRRSLDYKSTIDMQKKYLLSVWAVNEEWKTLSPVSVTTIEGEIVHPTFVIKVVLSQQTE
jgi:hypothetical protein